MFLSLQGWAAVPIQLMVEMVVLLLFAVELQWAGVRCSTSVDTWKCLAVPVLVLLGEVDDHIMYFFEYFT